MPDPSFFDSEEKRTLCQHVTSNHLQKHGIGSFNNQWQTTSENGQFGLKFSANQSIGLLGNNPFDFYSFNDGVEILKKINVFFIKSESDLLDSEKNKNSITVVHSPTNPLISKISTSNLPPMSTFSIIQSLTHDALNYLLANLPIKSIYNYAATNTHAYTYVMYNANLWRSFAFAQNIPLEQSGIDPRIQVKNKEIGKLMKEAERYELANSIMPNCRRAKDNKKHILFKALATLYQSCRTWRGNSKVKVGKCC